ncbi:MAG: hypothetical protein HY535_07550 [Chloroflexi bacterium]|nr:hypothetical protein [Chloroflexota bacterium]
MAVATDWRKARLQEADHAMLEFGEKLTLLPSAVEEKDAGTLRQHGFKDRDILSIVLAAAYRNFITRLADSLGVELKRDHAYTREILGAFGVNESELGTTIYGERQAAGGRDEGSPLVPTARGPAAPGDGRGMCWIRTASPERRRFAQVLGEWERLGAPSPMRNLGLAFGLRPEALEATLAFGRLVGMGGSGLGWRLEAIIGLVVAATLWVPYVGVHRAQALLEAGATSDEALALTQEPSGGKLGGPERDVARFAEQVARLPSAMARSDVEGLRESGFQDRDILTIASSVAFEAYLCCVAAGLGVGLEEDQTLAPGALDAFQLPARAGSR